MIYFCRSRRTWAFFAAVSLAVLWNFWPWIRPVFSPASGKPWMVVLDGYHRLDHSLLLQRKGSFRNWPILLITCPATGQPSLSQRDKASPPLTVLLESPPLGGDTAGQAAALADRLKDLPLQSRPSHLVLLTDSHHLPRAALVAQVAVGGLGTIVKSSSTDKVSPRLQLDHWSWQQFYSLHRDFLRMQFWRISGSTGIEFIRSNFKLNHRVCLD